MIFLVVTHNALTQLNIQLHRETFAVSKKYSKYKASSGDNVFSSKYCCGRLITIDTHEALTTTALIERNEVLKFQVVTATRKRSKEFTKPVNNSHISRVIRVLIDKPEDSV